MAVECVKAGLLIRQGSVGSLIRGICQAVHVDLILVFIQLLQCWFAELVPFLFFLVFV